MYLKNLNMHGAKHLMTRLQDTNTLRNIRKTRQTKICD